MPWATLLQVEARCSQQAPASPSLLRFPETGLCENRRVSVEHRPT